MMSEVPATKSTNEKSIEFSEKDALDQLSPYFPHEWAKSNANDITLTKISGGYMNTVYMVERSTVSILEPKQLLLRHKGGGKIDINDEERKGIMVSELEESIVALESSKAGTGPILYGLPFGGRVEEFVICHTLTPKDVINEQIRNDLAKCYARLHAIEVPLKLNAFETLSTIVKFGSKKLQENISMLDALIEGPFKDAPSSIDWNYLKSFNYSGEYEWALNVLHKIGFRLVTTAGDPNYLNVLVRDGNVPQGKLKVVLVDYELAIIQPRGIELGGHFANRILKWNDPINKSSSYSILDTNERQLFIDVYTNEIHQLKKHTNLDPLSLDSANHIMEETDIGILLYLIQFSFFIVAKLAHLTNDKSFPTSSVVMLKNYEKIKVSMLEKYPHWTN